jgi:hypothetical protein
MPSKFRIFPHKRSSEDVDSKELCLIKESMGWMGGKNRNVE